MNSCIESLESRIAPASLLSVTLENGALAIKGSASANDADNLQLDLSKIGSNALLSILNAGGKVKFGGTEFSELKLTKAQTDSIKSIRIDLGDGTNSTVFTSDSGASLSDPITYVGGSGTDTLTFGSNTKAFATTGNFSALLKTGNDRVIFTHNTQLGGNTLIDLGQGNDAILTQAAALNTGSALSFKNLSILGGDGNDSVALGLKTTNNKDLSVTGALRIDAGKGANDVRLFGNNVSLGNTTIKSLAKDKDFDVSLSAAQKLTVNGSLDVTASGAETFRTNEFKLEAPSIQVSGNVSYRGGAGADAVTVGAEATPRLPIIIAAGTEATSLQTLIGGGVTVKNGGGNNTTAIGNLNAALAIGKSVSVTGDSQSDSLSIRAASGALAGGVSAALGKGTNSMDVSSKGQLTVAGLKLSSNSAANEADSLNLCGVELSGALSAALGAGVSTVNIAQVIAHGSVSVNTGAGNDIVNVETDGGAGASALYGNTVIQTGLGSDTVTLGGDSAANKAVFMNGLSVDLGSTNAKDELMGVKLTDAAKVSAARSALLAKNTVLDETLIRVNQRSR
jgi:hypothetical protein